MTQIFYQTVGTIGHETLQVLVRIRCFILKIPGPAFDFEKFRVRVRFSILKNSGSGFRFWNIPGPAFDFKKLQLYK